MAAVTNKDQLEQALRRSEVRLRAAIESLPFDFWMIGPDGRYEMQNSTCRQLWGDVVGKRPDEVSPDEETSALWRENNRRAFAGEVIREEVSFTHPHDGKIRYWFNILSPIRDDEEVIGILGLNLDISELKETEQKLRRRNEELRAANAELERLGRSKDKLTAMISHELRTPLVTGLGYLDMLLEGKLGDVSRKVRSKMHIARSNLRRLSTLIDGFLRYQGLLNADATVTQARAFDLRRLIRNVVAELRPGLTHPRRLQMELPNDLPQVLGNREMLRMVIVNLLNNAAVHGGAGVSILIRAEPVERDLVRVTVEDNGPGIAPRVRETLFDPFVRASEDKESFGLGLAIVAAILKTHGSTPCLESEEGQGTRISFTLGTA